MDPKHVPTPDDQILRRVRGEYLEMPGLRLTEPQARRLWGLDCASCSHVLEALVETRFLCRKPDGTYARVSDGAGVRRSA